VMKKLLALLITLCLLLSLCTFAAAETDDSEWISFLLMCNEGMQNDGANVGNTMMVVSMAPYTGKLRLMMLTWDTFIEYVGYDYPQLIDQPYRNNGPEETMRVFNENFGMDIGLFLSLNYLNLAGLIDNFGGVDVDITRAERNALNSMVSSKKENIKVLAGQGLISNLIVDLMVQEYYLNDYGIGTHLNGLQAVGFGWLQYDSVYNCCQRELSVIGNLFQSIGKYVMEKVVFYTNDSGVPGDIGRKRAINLDDITDSDWAFLRQQIAPIFNMSYNNLTDDDINTISLALVHVAYQAARQGHSVFETIECQVFPLEALNAYDYVAGVPGHLVDYEANGEAMREFLYSPSEN